ncbi:interferon-induced GTP-binding protein Mx2 [Xylariaceae sp. FL0662B]|nr:interferon-induced GTP-binding protein Mx2 [Xylariaceae sp. FL0662B]
MATTKTGLGNQAVLTKIDKLRELNIGTMIPLPQSSVLEGLTGFFFPRAAGLCTRYATQITCCREPQDSVSVSIIPRLDADETLKEQPLKFQRCLPEMNNHDLAKIFEEANDAMGIRMSTADGGSGFGAFSQDILKIEISGPDQTHLTVIDVPGIFRVPTPGLTTESDVVLVQNMVKSYMRNNRTVILAVMPCNVDITTQEILNLAEVADPDGIRTMGVLTKPDLVTEKATQDAVMDLVVGKRNNLALGYCIVKNRSADDNTSTMSDRLAAEKAFFLAPPWSSVADRCGIASLQIRLREFLMHISNREFPHVKAEIEGRLNQRRVDLETMGPSRANQNFQRLYLGKIASRFQAITQCALNGHYAEYQVFKSEPSLKLATTMIDLNEALSDVFLQRGHNPVMNSICDLLFDDPLAEYPELSGIIRPDLFDCPKPLKGPIMDRVKEVYKSSRGPEIGTFGGTILATVFEEQSEKWEPLVLSHASNAITLVHDYISRLLTILCPEKQVRDQLWDTLLVDKLRDAYRRAMRHAHFLLAMERGGRPSTFNHYFNANLQNKRNKRMTETLGAMAISFAGHNERYVPIGKLEDHVANKDNAQQVCEDIVDTLMSYYKVSRKRFVDTICQQVVNHFLLDGDESPLHILSPELVMNLDPEQLEMIAGEDVASKRQRQILGREMESLEAAIKVLRA